jgi:hypothetical protein
MIAPKGNKCYTMVCIAWFVFYIDNHLLKNNEIKYTFHSRGHEMTVSYERLSGEPIIIFRFVGEFSVQDLLDSYRISQQEMANEPHIYRISDYTQAKATFAEVLAGIKTAASGQAGSVSSKNFSIPMVGTNHWVRLATDLMKSPQFGSIKIPIFQQFEDALSAARAQYQYDQAKTPVELDSSQSSNS